MSETKDKAPGRIKSAVLKWLGAPISLTDGDFWAAWGGGGKALTGRQVKEYIRNTEILPEPEQEFVPPFLAYVHPALPTEPIVRRVDTAQLLLQTSLHLAKLPSVEESGPEAASPFAHARKVAYPEGVKSRTTITKADSLLAENVTVEEKTSIRESVIGANCQIHEGARLAQCLLMDGVVVGKNCKLTGCVLGKRSEIGEGTTLTNCEVQENLLVEAKSKLSSLPPRYCN